MNHLENAQLLFCVQQAPVEMEKLAKGGIIGGLFGRLGRRATNSAQKAQGLLDDTGQTFFNFGDDATKDVGKIREWMGNKLTGVENYLEEASPWKRNALDIGTIGAGIGLPTFMLGNAFGQSGVRDDLNSTINSLPGWKRSLMGI